MQAHLAPNKIGKWGQLQEWQADRDEPTTPTATPRICSPSIRAGRSARPERRSLPRPPSSSLKARSNDHEETTGKPFAVDTTIGDSRRSWTWPWRVRRVGPPGRGRAGGHHGPRAAHLQHLAQSLLQSSAVPDGRQLRHHRRDRRDAAAKPCRRDRPAAALPNAWPTGHVKGLRARGGYKVDLAWRNGKLTGGVIHSKVGGKCAVRSNSPRLIEFDGKQVDSAGPRASVISFDTTAGWWQLRAEGTVRTRASAMGQGLPRHLNTRKGSNTIRTVSSKCSWGVCRWYY